MKFYTAVLALSILISAVSALEYAHCHLRGTGNDPTIEGTITFVTNGSLVTMSVNIDGITQNPDIPHGIHIHSFGDLYDEAAGTSVGGHWDLSGNPHACENTTDRHTGDTGNWEAVGGSIVGSKELDLIGLTGGNSVVGHAIILHNLTDDCTNNNLGNAGGRLAFCVIGVGNPSAFGETTNDAKSGITTNVPTRAVCDLKGTSGNAGISGRVWFEQDTPNGPTTVKARITGITGTHGFHIHEWGDLSSQDATATGGHYNPTNAVHAIPPRSTRHLGDMGNIFFYNGSDAFYEYTNDKISLSGTNNVIGRAVILHAAEDNCEPPVGNAGSRLAQCVIGIADAAAYDPVAQGFLDSGVPTTQDDAPCALVTTGAGGSSTTGTPVTEPSAAVHSIPSIVALLALVAFLLM